MADKRAVTSENAASWTQTQLAAALWQFSLAFYPSRQQLLLRLQDEHHANINLLLCLCWLSLQQRQLTKAQLTQMVAAIAPVNQQVTQPLRQIRRQLTADTLPLKSALLAAELQAEQQEQLTLANVLAGSWSDLATLTSAKAALQAYLCMGSADLAALQPLLVDLDQAICGYTPNHGETLI
jgi:uncharacterized protein (TIGR02444 family)